MPLTPDIAPRIKETFASIKREVIKEKDNASDGYLITRGDSKRLVVMIHGGPFASFRQDAFDREYLTLLMLGYSILVSSYRGTIGYGSDNLKSLLGKAGEQDVEDVGELILRVKKEKQFEWVALWGGSHGGFLSGWLLSHPKYAISINCAAIRNPAIDLNYMAQYSDIPEWAFAVASCSEIKFPLSQDLIDHLLQRSPISQAHLTKSPTLILLGGSDVRCPPP